MSGERRSAPFRFKQFTVQQERSAMKVGFDGILLGAWTDSVGCQAILDLGTGTGLLALMLAQRIAAAYKVADEATGEVADELARILAIEIDSVAVAEATENVRRSPWSDRIEVRHQSASELAGVGVEKFDLLICNPPYFAPQVTELHSESAHDSSRDLARHTRELTATGLFEVAEQLLNPQGRVSLIVPVDQVPEFLNVADRFSFHLRRRLLVRPLPAKPLHRALLDFRRQDGDLEETELTIEREHHTYTEQYRALAKDFYLKF